MDYKLKTYLSAASLLFSSVVNAEIELTIDKDLELLVLNGESMGFSTTNPDAVILNDGPNQLVVRVSKLISHNGEYEKFRSEPLVITFDAADKKLLIKPTRLITRQQQVNGYDKNPTVNMDENGQVFEDFHQETLPRGPGMIRDYEKELNHYNVNKGYIVPEVKPQLQVAKITNETVVTSRLETSVSSQNAMILLKADFLRLSDEQKQDFLKWAETQK